MRLSTLFVRAAVCLALVAGAGHADTDADALLEKAIKAHGGEEALTKYAALRVKLKRTDEPTRFTYNHDWLFAAPDKFKDTGDGSYLGRRITTVYATDGKATWSLVEGRAEDLTGKFAEWYSQQAYLMQVMRLAPLKGKEYELKAIGETKVEGKPALGLLVRAKGRKDVTLFFDADSGLLVKVEREVYDNLTEKDAKEERFYKNYPKKEALPCARSVVVKVGGKTTERYEVREIKFLEEADDKEFKRPR
jgi:hypothetical protein